MANTDQGYRIDLLAVDKGGRAILLGEVKAHPTKEAHAQEHLVFYLKMLRDSLPFALLADPERMRIYRWDGHSLSGPISTLPTIDVLGHYAPDIGNRLIFEDTLVTLIKAWLHDLAYHWKTERPPASDELARIALLPQLEEGDTDARVEVANGDLRRD
jgi:hypothetical protein